MSTITEKKLKKSADELEKIILKAKKKLFEFETLTSVREIQKGKFLEFKSAKELFENLEKVK